MKLITAKMIDDLCMRAAETERLRTNINIHESLADPVQRLFVAAGLSSYFRPHRHPDISEFAIVIRGLFDIVCFDDRGVVSERFPAGPESDILGFEIPAGVYHTWITRAEGSVFFEVKQGPYDPARAAVFAPWSPEEGSARVKAYQEKLLTVSVGERIV